jgi:hypothetical protein
MAEVAGRVSDADAETSGDPRPIEADLARQRAQLTRLVTELYRRGHELTDVGFQVRRHALAIAATFLAVGAIAAGSNALGVRRARRRNTLRARSGRLREAVGRVIDQPERVAAEPTVAQRIIGSAGSAAFAVLVKAALDRMLRSGQKR